MTDTRTIVAVDLYCGAGGTSTGVQAAVNELNARATNTRFDLKLIAVNHWDKAIASHNQNHPTLDGRCCDIRSIDPEDIVAEYGQVDLLCASPECTYHSNARGGRPFQNQSRISPNLLLQWAEVLQPKQILIENVHEFRKWGPLRETGRALNPDTGNIEPIYERIKERAGEYYDAFIENLRQLGYTVEDKVHVCADYGDPTTRKRLFIRALRHDGATLAPAWARQTHGPHAPRELHDQSEDATGGRDMEARVAGLPSGFGGEGIRTDRRDDARLFQACPAHGPPRSGRGGAWRGGGLSHRHRVHAAAGRAREAEVDGRSDFHRGHRWGH